MTDFILGVFEITIGMSLFIALLLIGLKLFGSKFTAKCRYIIWALVMIRLAIPFSFGLLPTLIEIPIDTELVQSEDLSSVLSENTDSVTSVQPSDPGDVVVTPTTPSTPVFPNVDTANPGSTPILPVTPTVPGDQAESVIPSDPVIETPTEQPVSLRQILDIAGIVYLTGAAIFLVWSLVSYFIYTRKILHSAKAADERTQKIFSTICKKYGIKKQPTLLVASGIHSPAAFGIFRRKIVLPDIAFSENGLVGTLAHEVTHCKRGDLYMKLVELIACSLNWFNPLVHIAAFKCEMEMELSCDEKVLSGSSGAARAAYADVMLDIIRRCRRNRGALTTHFNPKKSAVTARFKNILYGSGKRRGRILIGVCLVLCILAGAFVACQTGDDLTDDHWYAEGYYLKCDNGSDVIVMDADGANPASPCEMTAADEAVSFEGLTDGDRIKVEISMIMTTYPGQTDVYSIEKLSDGERDDIDPAVMESLRELGWIDDTSNQKELPKYLEIPAITLTQIETLPYSEKTAVFTASPVGGNPTIFFFDDSRTFYFRKYLSTNMDAEFFTGTLTLPDGFTDAKLLHVTSGAGSGEIFVSIEAIYDGKKEYLTYGFFGTEAPSGVDVLDEVQVQRLMAAMKQISTTQITEYKFNIPLEDRLDYIVPASIYGEIHPYVIPDRYAPYIQTNEYSPDGVGYVTFGVTNDMKPSNVFSRCYTYRITQKGGYFVSVEEVETITKETVLQNGTPYSGNSAGRFTGVAYDRTRTATVSGNEISVGSYQSHTDAGGTYVGTYTYDAKTGDFFAELAFQYHDNGNFITNDPETISGKLYEYGGFVHFVCTSSNISTVNVNDTLPMTFFPMASNEEYQMTKYTETLTGDNGKTYQISFDLPAEWTYGSGGIFEDVNGNKRIGNRVIAVDISKEDFVSSLEEMAERYHVDLDSPIKGTSDSGIAYMGYCFEGEREIPGDITGRYLYRFTYSDSISMHMDVWKINAYDDDSYYEQFVLPIIQSVTIRETGDYVDTITSLEDYKLLGPDFYESYYEYTRALIDGDTAKMEELSMYPEGTLDSYKDVRFTFKSVTREAETGRFILTAEVSEGHVVIPGGTQQFYYCEYPRRALVPILEPPAPNATEASAELSKLLNMTMKFNLDEMEVTEYVIDCLYRKTGKTNFTENEIVEYAKKCFGVDSFTPNEHFKRDGVYTSLAHGGNHIYHDVISTNYGYESGIYSVTVRFYADYAKTVYSHLIKYTMVKLDGDFSFLAQYIEEESPLKPFTHAT